LRRRRQVPRTALEHPQLQQWSGPVSSNPFALHACRLLTDFEPREHTSQSPHPDAMPQSSDEPAAVRITKVEFGSDWAVGWNFSAVFWSSYANHQAPVTHHAPVIDPAGPGLARDDKQRFRRSIAGPRPGPFLPRTSRQKRPSIICRVSGRRPPCCFAQQQAEVRRPGAPTTSPIPGAGTNTTMLR